MSLKPPQQGWKAFMPAIKLTPRIYKPSWGQVQEVA